MEDLTEEEQSAMARLSWFWENMGGFNVIQSQAPQTLAHALDDSPSGLLGWNSQLMLDVEDPDFVVANAAVYWFTRTSGSSMRLYREMARAPRESHGPTTAPTALASAEGTSRASDASPTATTRTSSRGTGTRSAGTTPPTSLPSSSPRTSCGSSARSEPSSIAASPVAIATATSTGSARSTAPVARGRRGPRDRSVRRQQIRPLHRAGIRRVTQMKSSGVPVELIFVHGALVRDGEWWWRRAADLLRERTGIQSRALALPSCGETAPEQVAGGLVADAAALRRELDDVDSAIVVGHSYGGTVIAEAGGTRGRAPALRVVLPARGRAVAGRHHER
ncbi:alpha/beta fold hydrolase [Oerskovia sp. M15]